MTDVDFSQINDLLAASVGASNSEDEAAAISGCCIFLDKLQPDALRRVFQYLGSRYIDSARDQVVQLDKHAALIRSAIADGRTADLHGQMYQSKAGTRGE